MFGNDKTISILDHLTLIFRGVQRAVAAGDVGWNQEITHNAKGDTIKWFDFAADKTVYNYFKERFPYSTLLLSEEDSPRKLSAGQPEFTVVLDPIDGSDNFARGMAPVGVAMALIPQSCPISVESVRYALVGDLITGDIYTAERGSGAFCNGKEICTGACNVLKSAMISCEMNHFAVREPLANILSRVRGVRSLGCTTRAMTMVASGSLDAHLDLRDRLTPENFLAPSLILTEAGGTISMPQGVPIPEITNLTRRFSVIASGSPELHAVLVQQLKGDTICS